MKPWYKEYVDITIDSRQVAKGGLFVAISGHTVDGHRFIPQAIEKGAAGIVIEKERELECKQKYPDFQGFIPVENTEKTSQIISSDFYENPSQDMTMIGVTGTNGKTTIATMLYHMMQNEKPVGYMGTLGFWVGDEKLDGINTTPEAITLQKMLQHMKEKGAEHIAMEVSSYGLSTGRTTGVKFQYGVFTNLTPEHLDCHGTMENYRNAKGILFENLKENGTAILNGDDNASTYYRSISTGNVLMYGLKDTNDLLAKNIKETLHDTYFDVFYKGETYPCHIPFVGLFNVYNTLAVLGVCVLEGMTMTEAIEKLKNIPTTPGRMQSVPNDKGIQVLVDYAHTPDALENVLITLSKLRKEGKKLITVFGCGGDRDASNRAVMGEISMKYSDIVVLTSDNPRNEDPVKILEDVEKGMTNGTYKKLPDRGEAIYYAIEQATEGDIVVIAGKGHEDYQIVGDVTTHFDDAEVALEALQK